MRNLQTLSKLEYSWIHGTPRKSQNTLLELYGNPTIENVYPKNTWSVRASRNEMT